MKQKIINPETGRGLLLFSTKKSFFEVVALEPELPFMPDIHDELFEQLNMPFEQSGPPQPEFNLVSRTIKKRRNPTHRAPVRPQMRTETAPKLARHFFILLVIYTLFLTALWAIIHFK